MSIEDSAGIALIPDLLMIELTLHHPQRMLWYILITVAGTTVGSLILFFIARKLGEAWVEKRMPAARFHGIHAWFERNELLAVAVPAATPPPLPFKLFVLVAGLFEMSWAHFSGAMAAGRFVRYWIEAWLALRYGPSALKFFGLHPWLVGGAVLALFAVAYGIGRARGSRSHSGRGGGADPPANGSSGGGENGAGRRKPPRARNSAVAGGRG